MKKKRDSGFPLREKLAENFIGYETKVVFYFNCLLSGDSSSAFTK